MKRELYPDNITVYRDESGHVIAAFQDIPIYADDMENLLNDSSELPEIIGYSTVSVDWKEQLFRHLPLE